MSATRATRAANPSTAEERKANARHQRTFYGKPGNREKRQRYEQARRRGPGGPEYRRKRRLQDVFYIYGLTKDEHGERVWLQGGVCAICQRPPKGGKRLGVDHDHATGVVRGLLCVGCNVHLDRPGKVRESPRGIEYLSRSVSREIFCLRS